MRGRTRLDGFMASLRSPRLQHDRSRAGSQSDQAAACFWPVERSTEAEACLLGAGGLCGPRATDLRNGARRTAKCTSAKWRRLAPRSGRETCPPHAGNGLAAFLTAMGKSITMFSRADIPACLHCRNDSTGRNECLSSGARNAGYCFSHANVANTISRKRCLVSFLKWHGLASYFTTILGPSGS